VPPFCSTKITAAMIESHRKTPLADALDLADSFHVVDSRLPYLGIRVILKINVMGRFR
jgi:hypothetical protein